jgi:hypothetical protein
MPGAGEAVLEHFQIWCRPMEEHFSLRTVILSEGERPSRRTPSMYPPDLRWAQPTFGKSSLKVVDSIHASKLPRSFDSGVCPRSG